MSTANEQSLCEQVLYRGKKQKWEHKNISVKKNDRNGKYVMEVKKIPRREMFWKLAKKPEAIELVPNSYAVVHLDDLNNHRNVLALIHLSRNSQITGVQFFTSENTQVVCNIRDVLSKCCDGVSFDVAVSNVHEKTHLLIFHDRVCLTRIQGYDFTLHREWPIESLTQVTATAGSITLVMTKEGRKEPFDLRTEQGNEIKVLLSDKIQCLSPAILRHLSCGLNIATEMTHCDGNSNIVPTAQESQAFKANPVQFTVNNHKTQGQFPSPNESTCLSRKTASSGDVRLTPLHLQSVSGSKLDSQISAVTHSLQHDDKVHTQNQLKVNNTKETYAHDCEGKPERKHAKEDLEHEPPPVPQRQLKPSGKQTTQSDLVTGEMSANDNNMGDFTLPRTRSFQIVQQPLNERKRQRHNSLPGKEVRKTITELVRPICEDPPPKKSENGCEDELLDLEPSSNVGLPTDRHYTVAKSEDNRKDYEHHKLPDMVENKEEPATDKLRSKHHKLANVAENKGEPAGDKLHYVNLPQGFRPSCYLYMNLPDPKKAPKESVTYVNHVYMGRSMKGIYENVFPIMSECPEGKESVPELPPPTLQPRQPPPRIPQRLPPGRQVPRNMPPKFPTASPLPCPPPRPPRKSLKCTSASKEDIQVQIAVFASRAVVSRVWYLRIVVMKHDPDDTTFKTVKERELASKYHLLQTYPCSISSDIIISLKHQCQQFKLTSEDSQEVDYHIIENLVHGFWFVVEFHLEHLSNEVDQFVGNVCVEPKGLPVGEKCPINKKFNLGITEDFELKQQCSKCEKPGSYDTEHQPCKSVISDYTLRRKVCQQLDNTMHSCYNWKDVAGRLEFSVQDINNIEYWSYRHHGFSPMEDVLSRWEQRDPQCSLERLVSILREIQRLDVVCELGYPVDWRSS